MTAAAIQFSEVDDEATYEWARQEPTVPTGQVPTWYRETLDHQRMVACALRTVREVLWTMAGLAALLAVALWMLD